jgi:serine/threonine-protein kinase
MRRTAREELPPDAPVRIGDVIAEKYRVERLLGRGGMAFVVAAEHLYLGERVAIKVLLPRTAVKAGAFERFLREGRAAAKIRSEHVARVHDSGLLPTGEPYLVLELLEGADLRALLRRRGKLPVGTAVSYVLEACEALAEAHALGIVHRDLKPANLFLARRRDGSSIVKVIDFGISKITSSAEDGAEETLTETRAAFGTPHYMAPEQMRSARDVDARADIWSLGAVLHGLLTGAPPFPGETMIDVYDRILQGPPPLRERVPEVPERLEEIVRRCLRVRPEERPRDVAELALALRDVAPPEARASADRAALFAGGLPATEAPGPLDGEASFDDVSERASRATSETPSGRGAPTGPEGLTTAASQEPSWAEKPAGRAAADNGTMESARALTDNGVRKPAPAPGGNGRIESAPPLAPHGTVEPTPVLTDNGTVEPAPPSADRPGKRASSRLRRSTGLLVLAGGLVLTIGGVMSWRGVPARSGEAAPPAVSMSATAAIATASTASISGGAAQVASSAPAGQHPISEPIIPAPPPALPPSGTTAPLSAPGARPRIRPVESSSRPAQPAAPTGSVTATSSAPAPPVLVETPD